MSGQQRPRLLARAVCWAWVVAAPGLAPAEGPVLHLVIGCITEDGTSERGVKNRWLYNGDRMQELFRANVAPEQLTVTRIATWPMTAAAVIEQVGALQGIGPEDALVFYYAGHGGYDQENRQFFILLPSRDQLYRQTLFAALAGHHPRLLTLISDCCYVYTPMKEGPGMLGQAPPPAGKPVTSPLFQALFFQASGVVDITSAGRDQSSYWLGDYTNGSLFGRSLRGVLADFNQQPLTWGQVVARVRKRTAAEFQQRVKSLQTVELPNGREVAQTTQTPYAFTLPGPHLGIRAHAVPGVDGLRIDETAPPASDAGIKAGDVLQNINGKAIHSEDELYDAVLEATAGSFEVQLVDGKTAEKKNVTVRPH